MPTDRLFRQGHPSGHYAPPVPSRPEVKLERQPGAAARWCWIIHRDGRTLVRSEVTHRGAEAAWEAGRAALERLGKAGE